MHQSLNSPNEKSQGGFLDYKLCIGRERLPVHFGQAKLLDPGSDVRLGLSRRHPQESARATRSMARVQKQHAAAIPNPARRAVVELKKNKESIIVARKKFGEKQSEESQSV